MVAGICCGSQKASTSQIATIFPISGQVWQQKGQNQLPLKHIRVKLFCQMNTPNGSYNRLVAQTRSDQNGNYRFVIHDTLPDVQYFVVAQSDKKDVLYPHGKAVFIDKAAPFRTYPLEVQQKAWLKLHVLRKNPQNGDKVRLYLGAGELYEMQHEMEAIWLSRPKAGNAYFHFTYGLQQLGKNRISVIDSVFLTANDTSYVVLRL